MDNEKQKDEIIALESICNEEEFSYHEENHLYQCTLNIFVNLPPGYYLTYKDNRHSDEPLQKVEISHLPPLSLLITLPEDYPSTSPPKFTLCSSWLRLLSLTKLCKKLDKLWEENKGQEILFVWMAFLQDETLKFLNIEESLGMNHAYTLYRVTLEKAQNVQKSKDINDSNKVHVNEISRNQVPKKANSNNQCTAEKNFTQKNIDKRAILDCPIGRNPIQLLIDYNEKRNQIEFKKNFYTCKICFTDRSGQHCTQFLPCTHVFCKDCISGYLEVRIKEGSVQNICCPEEKCTSEATPGQIKDLVSPELFAKYDSILLSATLDTMTDIVYCPRRHCQYPVSWETNEQVANCPVCQYAFCVHCKMVYHGIEPCKVSLAEKQKLVSEYQKASDEEKVQMEQRYGKKQLQLLVENTMSENWIDANSHNCPHCNAAIEKSDGCNKMTCWRCNTYFCWLCGIKLNPEVPYLHFRNPESKCFNMLYHNVAPDENDDDDDFDIPAIYLGYDTEDEDYYDDDFEIELDI